MNYRYWFVSFNTPVGIGAGYYRTEQGQHLHHPESMEAWHKTMCRVVESITPIVVQELEKEVAMARWPRDFVVTVPKQPLTATPVAGPTSRPSARCRLCDGARVCVDGNCMDDTPHPCHRCHGRG